MDNISSSQTQLALDLMLKFGLLLACIAFLISYLNRALANQYSALQAVNQELDQFAYVASHDLKAPLRAIANLSEWIEEDLGPSASEGDTKQHLTLLRGRVKRMENLIDGLLQYSRAGRVGVEPEPVDCGALVDEVIADLAPPSGFTVVTTTPLPTLQAARLPLSQVFANLISNAVKYHDRDDGRIEISARDMGDRYEFHVSDDGPGIAPQYHKKVFEIFQTLAARDQVEGTGIGLSLVRKLVESQGGSVGVRSEPGSGATFYFTWLKRK